jgi:hypothetical protein
LILRAIVIAAFAGLAVANASAQEAARPPVGGVGSLPDAMIFYVAHGEIGACGPGCSDWIAAEGAVYWDTHKRLLAILDRIAGRKLPLVIDSRGEGNLNVAVSLGRILREHGMAATAGPTRVLACASEAAAACFAQKRAGGPLEARVDFSKAVCDFTCILILAGGVERSLAGGTRVLLSSVHIGNRLGLNVSSERREGLTTRFGEQFRNYLLHMGVDPHVMDTVEDIPERAKPVMLPPAEWSRLHIVNGTPL